MQDYLGDFETDVESISYDGPVTMSATAIALNGEAVDLIFSVDVSASVDYFWETDEQPTGWNHSTDRETYSTSYYAEVSPVTIHAVSFDTTSPFTVQDKTVPFQTINKYVHPATLKQLLNPTIYVSALASAFQREVDRLEPPSDDLGDEYEPDDYKDY